MSAMSTQKIDVYAHIIPPKLTDLLFEMQTDNPTLKTFKERVPTVATLYDLDQRFRIMDKFPEVIQVLSVAAFSVDDVAKGPKDAVELAQRVNDEVAELVYKYPDRFAAGTALLPMSNMDAAMKELDRTINDLKFRGVLVRIPINGKPVDRPEFLPLYEKMCQYNLPIFWHPQARRDRPDYADEAESKYFIWHLWGLVYETTASMTRLVFSGIMEKFPKLKIITHHAGAMVPYFSERIVNHYNESEMRDKWNFKQGLTEPHIDYFRRFYNDTAILGNTPALMCAYDFCGADHLLFGTDMPFDSQLGAYGPRKTIEAIEQMTIPESDKRKIFAENTRKLLRLAM
jgi:predicted TIM-barrel fold metal-dependent hydrolase